MQPIQIFGIKALTLLSLNKPTNPKKMPQSILKYTISNPLLVVNYLSPLSISTDIQANNATIHFIIFRRTIPQISTKNFSTDNHRLV